MNKKLQKRLNKRKQSLERLRDKWKKGFTEEVKVPPIQTKKSVRAVRGGLPGSGK